MNLRAGIALTIATVGLNLVPGPWNTAAVHAQPIPSKQENIDYLVTFGNAAEVTWGDDDFSQVFFFLIPNEYEGPVYIRVFDPDIGGAADQVNEAFNTETRFEVYGGQEAFSHPDAKKLDPEGGYKSGTLLASKTFGDQPEFDGKWYTFGPFNPEAGEADSTLKGHLFKVIAEGISGDDGNLYRYFLSQKADENVPIRKGNGFTYEYSFRLKQNTELPAHIYPFVDANVISIYQNNFDFDRDGYIKLYSVVKNGHLLNGSINGEWNRSNHAIREEEYGKSLDIRILSRGTFGNDMVFYVTNQYKQPMPFFAVPIGGKPKYAYKVNISSNITR